MLRRQKNMIMIVASVIMGVLIIGTATVTLLKDFNKTDEVVKKDIYELPNQTVYFVNDFIYDEGIDPKTIDKNIQVDYTRYILKDNLKQNLNINLVNKLTNLQKNKNEMYGLYENAIVILNDVNKIRKLTPEEDKILDFKIKGDNILKYVERTIEDNKQKTVALELYNMYDKTTKQIIDKEIKSFDMDEDGIYFIADDKNMKDKLIRIVWNSEYQKVDLGEVKTDNIVKIEDWIYFIDQAEENNQLCRIYKDGSKRETVTKEKFKIVEEKLEEKEENKKEENKKEEDKKEENKKDKKIKLKLETPKQFKKASSASGYLAGYLDTLYYINTIDGNKLYKIQLSTKEETPIINNSVKEFKLENGYIYYTLDNEEGVNVMSESGVFIKKILNQTPSQYVVL